MSIARIIGESATKVLLNAVTVTGASDAWLPVASHKTFHIIITGTATVRIQATNNVMTGVSPSPLAANWITLGIASATMGFENGFPWKAVRANVTSIGAVSSVTVILGT